VWKRPTVHHSYRQPFLHELLQAQQRLLRLAEQQRAAAEWQDARNVEVTQRACQALSLATGHALPERADAWWNWWDEHNEVSYATEKPTYERVDSNVVGSFLPELPGEYVRHSCLVAGTHVLTETGSVAVEEIEPGDRVLAQDPESGELAYKPVLRTTRRDPVETLTLDAGEAGSLSCTGGHQFWVSGKGWLRARQLEPGMMLHTVDGSAELQQASKGPTAEVFNLVVADFHSYFVADGKWLSHDITPQAPTNTIVPGLLAAR
jgi:hypothetical protein